GRVVVVPRQIEGPNRSQTTVVDLDLVRLGRCDLRNGQPRECKHDAGRQVTSHRAPDCGDELTARRPHQRIASARPPSIATNARSRFTSAPVAEAASDSSWATTLSKASAAAGAPLSDLL